MFQKIAKNSACVLSAVLVLATLACSDNKKKSPTDPVDPEAPIETVTSRFSGQLPQLGEVCHFFMTAAAGEITAGIVELKPLSSLTVGLSLGRPADIDPSICSIIGEDRSARINETFLSANNPAGEYCVCIFDVGNIFPGEVVTYKIDVEHR